ncbi:hypothetical protein A2159_03615 [Candidatus Woesebacteria bacterium RBG_13_34_9]|uniref:Baseplate protein J-like domain-containing protein n=1 Tax=Candidatus Woesebacteria bacterium RBG_13_34_9 TaxID=1802477 RepID=A0A1F7X381_9BACT|nr:MAG: hypothetical protein A2159_03615 [Candidatus Woesebacteria bacterium RBG_13_34_9]
MDLKKFLPNKENSDKKEYFWSLIIEPEWVQSCIWRIEKDKAQVVLASNTFSWQSDEDLIQSTDSALSSVIQGFPEDLVEPTKTVFGVISSWVKEGQISDKHLARIKKLCTELELSPIGFVVIPEAISNFYKSEEGTPLNAVVIGVHKEIIEITIFSLGKLLGTTQVARSVSVVDDVTEGISRFQIGNTPPSRFLIYDGREGELEEVRQELLKVNWEDFAELKFLHTPKVEIIDTHQKIYAVSLAGASELADIKGLEIVDKKEEFEIIQEKETLEGQEQLGEESVDAESLGFVRNKDITDTNEIKKTLERGDLEETTESEIDDSHKNVQPVGLEDYFKKPSKINVLNKLTLFLNGLTSKFKRFKLRIPIGISLPGKTTFLFGLLFLLVIFISGFCYWWFYPKSTVTIYLSPQNLSEAIDLSIGIDKSSESTTGYIQGRLLEKDLSGEKSKSATGTKTVGDKSKGEVTIYRAGSEINLPGGTILTGPGSLKFVLDRDVVIASGSAGTPGVTKTSITAFDIGAQYNLASGSNFSVGNHSTTDLEAKNESSFSGGSSREITAVSSDDQKILEEDLTKELIDKARTELEKDIDESEYFVDESISEETLSKSFSKKVGDEADSVKLSMEIKAKGLVVEKTKLVEISFDSLKEKVPQGFVFRENQIDFDFDKVGKQGNNFRVKISANLLPEVKTDEISNRIRGKYPNVVEAYLRQAVPGFTRVEIKIKPTFPGKLKTLPHIEKNIEIEIASDR